MQYVNISVKTHGRELTVMKYWTILTRQEKKDKTRALCGLLYGLIIEYIRDG